MSPLKFISSNHPLEVRISAHNIVKSRQPPIDNRGDFLVEPVLYDASKLGLLSELP